jgi:hypothetical protein
MTAFTFKPGPPVEADNWSLSGEKITSAEKLDAIRAVLEKDGPILVQHRFLRQASAPDTRVFDDFDDFVAYLTEHAHAGDNIYVWSLWPLNRDTQPLAHGKCPDVDGYVPEGGAY